MPFGMEYESFDAPQSNTGDPSSFGFVSARDRWPVILTGAIDDITRTAFRETNAEKVNEAKEIIQGISILKYELQHDRQMAPLADDGGLDIAGYNGELQKRGYPKWLNSPWLFTECYLYRRMHTLFSRSIHWRRYDVFSAQKITTFRSSRPAVLELAARYNDLTAEISSGEFKQDNDNVEKALFTEMCEICLWGNATDLSLLTNLTHSDIQKLQGAEARRANESNILVNDFPAAFACLKRAKLSAASPAAERRVDIVLDNAGFELFVDLVLAGYLLQSGLATQIVLHPKNMPWFVSDVVPRDFNDLLNFLVASKSFYETASVDEEAQGTQPPPLSAADEQNLKSLFDNWTGLYGQGQIILRPNIFWTEGGSYWRMPHTAPALFHDLRDSELVIFKGDLNYRKLTGDAWWDPTTSFDKAIGPLGHGSGMRTLALRTCKADVVVGLPKGKDEELRGEHAVRSWAWSGKYAVVSFCDGKT